ncbi:hypothetical protein Tco_1341448, partial [Tanacetum coccineum]
MSRSTISSESLVESIGSSALPARVSHPITVVDSEFELFEDPTLQVDSDSDSFENSPNSEPFRGPLDTNSNPEELSEEEPSEDDPTDASSGIDEPPAQIVPALQISPISSAPIVQSGHELPVDLYMTLEA